MTDAFPVWLQAQIDARGWGVSDAARELRVSHSMLSNYLNDKQRPERKTIRKLAAGLGVAPSEIEAILDAEEARRRGAHAPGLGPTGVEDDPAVLLRRLRERVNVDLGTATVQLRDPAQISAFFGFLERWPRMTPEEAGSLLADEADIPGPGADREERDAAGGGAGPGGAPGAGDRGGRDR